MAYLFYKLTQKGNNLGFKTYNTNVYRKRSADTNNAIEILRENYGGTSKCRPA